MEVRPKAIERAGVRYDPPYLTLPYQEYGARAARALSLSPRDLPRGLSARSALSNGAAMRESTGVGRGAGGWAARSRSGAAAVAHVGGRDLDGVRPADHLARRAAGIPARPGDADRGSVCDRRRGERPPAAGPRGRGMGRRRGGRGGGVGPSARRATAGGGAASSWKGKSARSTWCAIRNGTRNHRLAADV